MFTQLRYVCDVPSSIGRDRSMVGARLCLPRGMCWIGAVGVKPSCILLHSWLVIGGLVLQDLKFVLLPDAPGHPFPAHGAMWPR